MKSKLAALAVMGACFTAPAFAACPTDALQSAINTYLVVAAPNADSPKALAAIDALVAACPTQPHVLKAAAMTYATAPPGDAKTAVKRLAHARELFRQMWANMEGVTPVVRVTGANNNPILFGFDDLYEIEKQVRNLLFRAEQAAGELAPEDMPIGAGAPVRACESGDYSDSLHANTWLNDRDHPGAFNALDRIVQYCSKEIDSGKYAVILTQRARSLIASAKRAPDAPDTLDKLKRAQADITRYYAMGKKPDYVYWRATEARELSALIVKAGGAPPKGDWFKPALIADPSTLEFIALTFDAAWAEDSKIGPSGLYKNYRARMAQLYALAVQSPDARAARSVLFRAAKNQATGGVRAPENANLKAPPDYLYKWVDPDYVAPPTTPPTPQ